MGVSRAGTANVSGNKINRKFNHLHTATASATNTHYQNHNAKYQLTFKDRQAAKMLNG